MNFLPDQLKFRPLVILAALFFIFSGCIKDNVDLTKISNQVDWNVKYGTPVAYGSLSLNDIVKSIDDKGYIKEDKDGLLYLVYKNNIFSQSAATLLPIPNQIFSQTFTVGDVGFPSGTGQDSVKFTKNIDFDFSFNKSDVEIDYMIFKMGLLQLTTKLNVNYASRVTITMPTLIRNGKPFVKVIKGVNQTVSPVAENLKDYKLSFETNNKIPVIYEVMITNSKIGIQPGTNISTDINLEFAAFSSIVGYLGSIPDLLNAKSQKITLSFFDSEKNYNVGLEDPKVNIYIKNSFGLPIRLDVSNAKTYSDKTASYSAVNISPSTIDVKYPNLTQIGQTVKDSITFTSNFFDLIKTSPHYFYYDVTAVANPLGNTVKNFFTDTSKVSVDMELNLPFSLYAENLEGTDTVKFDLGNTVSDFSILKKLSIYSSFTNSIPFDLKVQVILTDDHYLPIDTLYKTSPQPAVKSGILTSTGRYTFGPSNILGIVYDEATAKKFKNVKYAVIKVGMSTAGASQQKYVKFYSDYRLKVAFQVQTELHVTSLDQF